MNAPAPAPARAPAAAGMEAVAGMAVVTVPVGTVGIPVTHFLVVT
ncbi:hypothetical protein ACIBM3_18570 [Rhodococcus erythropolis]